MECTDNAVVAYTIDSRNRLTWVCEHWWPFARDNGGAALHPDNVLGKDLLDFISDGTTRLLYELALDRIRQAGVSITFDLRCDSPDRRRFLSMSLHGSAGGEVCFESRTLRQETRPPIALLSPDGRLPGSGGTLLRVCSWCKRIAVGRTTWLEVEQALPRLDAMTTTPPPAITHAMCPACLETTMAAIRRGKGGPSTP